MRLQRIHSLKLVLAEVLEEEQMDRNVSNDIDRDLRQSLQNILANKVAEPMETVNMMDPANLEHVLDRLEHARMVCSWQPWQYHSRGSGRRLQIQPAGNTGCGRIYGKPRSSYLNLGQEDVVMVISNSGSSKRLQTLAEGQRKTDARSFSLPIMEIRPWPGYDYKIVTATRKS